MTGEATLDDFEPENSSDESRSLALEEQLLKPISPSVGLRLIPGRDDPLSLFRIEAQNGIYSTTITTGSSSSNPQRKTQKRRSFAGCISQQTGPNGWLGRRFIDGR
jgi:hypothetical protein